MNEVNTYTVKSNTPISIEDQLAKYFNCREIIFSAIDGDIAFDFTSALASLSPNSLIYSVKFTNLTMGNIKCIEYLNILQYLQNLQRLTFYNCDLELNESFSNCLCAFFAENKRINFIDFSYNTTYDNFTMDHCCTLFNALTECYSNNKDPFLPINLLKSVKNTIAEKIMSGHPFSSDEAALAMSCFDCPRAKQMHLKNLVELICCINLSQVLSSNKGASEIFIPEEIEKLVLNTTWEVTVANAASRLMENRLNLEIICI